jgi:large subunit ribosomal protein L31
MKEGIHPTYYPDAKVTCSCGNTWSTGSTQKELRVEICSTCHPYFSGESQRIVDIEGQVDRFYKKLQARQDYVEENKVRKESKTSPKRPILELELGKRPTEALATAGITTVGQFMDKLSEGEETLLAISGFGRTSLINLKKKLRSLGYDVPEAEVAA